MTLSVPFLPHAALVSVVKPWQFYPSVCPSVCLWRFCTRIM